MPQNTSIPFGMRDCKIFPYSDAQGTTLAALGYDLPNIQTFSFADTEDFTDLRGDDNLVATHGSGATVKWSLESGGISIQIWAILSGGQIIETGTTPNRVTVLRKCGDDTRPYFLIVGQILSDSGGDLRAKVYRCKAKGDLSGQFGDGKFFVTNADGVGLPIPGSKLLYDIVQYEQSQFISTTPDPIPSMPPKNVIVGNIATTTLTLIWEAVTGATAYVVEKSVNAGTTWTSAGANPAVATLAVTGLTTATPYLFRVSSIVGGVTSGPSATVAATTL